MIERGKMTFKWNFIALLLHLLYILLLHLLSMLVFLSIQHMLTAGYVFVIITEHLLIQKFHTNEKRMKK